MGFVRRRGFWKKLLSTIFLVVLTVTTVFGVSGWYEIEHPHEALAANNFSMKTGYYYGTGVTQTISGLGFTPQMVLVKAESAAGSILWKSSAMASGVTAYLGVATADNTESEILLTSDGFTVSVAAEVNTVHTRYVYIAFGGSDCTSNGTMCIGAYTGNGASNQAITAVGFQPDLVISKRSTAALAGTFRTSIMSNNHAAFLTNTANDTSGIYYRTLDATGFTVGSTNNVNGGLYYYVAFKNVATQLYVGSFLGDGLDNKEITGVGFEPDFVLVKANAALVPTFNTTESWGDLSAFTSASASAVNQIQELKSDGFQVGTGTSANSAAVTSHYFAFGGSPDPAGSGSFYITSGSYTGNGTSQTITTTFAPDLVIVKAATNEHGVFSLSILRDSTQYIGQAVVGFSGGITSMSETGFSVGSHSTVNTNGIVYEYTAFGNATSPTTGDGAANFSIGAYTGNGLSPRAIDHLGFGPSMVLVKKPTTTVNTGVWTSSTMSANTTAYLQATADLTDGTGFRSLDASGFTIGSGTVVNTVTTPYLWFAFSEGANFDVGSYTGNGVAGTNITAPGFDLGYVWVKRSTAVAGAHRSTSATITGSNAQYFVNTVNTANIITGFVSGGFTVGSDTSSNANAGAYQYAAWKASDSVNPPSTPSNSAPANGATDQDLNVTLTGSAYSDPDNTAQIDAQWQVDDDSDFATPVWTRTASAAEVSTTVDSLNGTFANELSGDTALDHNATYYWRVRYSDGVWSAWSTGTSLVTNIIATPTNASPADTATVTTLTPTLTASAFSDPQSGHTTGTYAQWQISSSSSFASVVYDSGSVSYATSLAVPSATLANLGVYYWRVKYADATSQWSEYSSPTRFLVNESQVSVRPLFGSTVIDQGDNLKIDAQVKLSSGAVINDATVTIDIYNPSGTKIVTGATMSYIASSNGIYRYAYTVPAVSGSYLYVVTAVADGRSGYGAANFEVRTLNADVESVQSAVDSEAVLQASERSSQDAERSAQEAERVLQQAERDAQEAERTAQAASRGVVEGVATDVSAVQNNLDVLLGAVIVTQSSVNDAAATTTSFVTSLVNTSDDFYNNAVLTFTSGPANGQTRRIADYNGTTKLITLDPALSFAPANGNTFTIVKQNVYVEQQLAAHESAESSFRAETIARLTDIESKVDAITATLNTVDTDLADVQTTLDSVRTSQLRGYTIEMSDVSEIQAGTGYRATLTILDYEANPVDAVTTPTIDIYDATRTLMQDAVSMTKLSDGVYEYTFDVLPDDTAGLWESIVHVDIDGTGDVLRNDYWQVTGAPAQVLLNSISDLTVPTVAATTTITNEGGGAYEYQYEWCVVASQDNQCGGSDDVYYASAAKLIDVGEDFVTSLTATVPTVGDYWFKVVAYYGTESSGASRFFTATAEDVEDTDDETGGGSSGSGRTTSGSGNTSDVYDEIVQVRQDLAVNAQQLSLTLELLGMMSPDLQKLLGVSVENTEKVKDIQNKIADLKAVSTATRRIIEQKTVEPIVETYMKFNSVEIHFLITNPSDEAQVVKFKAFLPEEARPEHILDSSGLNVDYDTGSGVYYVSGDIPLGPHETLTKKVEMTDIWVFSDEQVASIKAQVDQLMPALMGTQYEAQGVIYQSDIEATLSTVLLRQKESYSSPQDHIVAYRENSERMLGVEKNVEKLKDLVVQAGASRGVVGEVGGIQTFATWGIILAIVFGFGLMSAVIFAMWRSQTMLAAAALGVQPHEIQERLNAAKQRRRVAAKKPLTKKRVVKRK